MGVFFAVMVLWVGAQTAPASRPEACSLLTHDEVKAVQGAAVREAKGSSDVAKSLHFAQCLFATTEFARSVSVTVISDGPKPGGARDYWTTTFDPKRRLAKKHPFRPIAELGDEAFWTGDARAGSLYVLIEGRVLRISVGGVQDVEERIRRSKTLAQAALSRLQPKNHSAAGISSHSSPLTKKKRNAMSPRLRPLNGIP